MPTENDHRFHRRAIVDSIQRVATDLFGATIVERRPFPEASFAIRVVDDPLAGIRAAALALSVGRARLYDFAFQARSVGRLAGHRRGARDQRRPRDPGRAGLRARG